MSGHTTAEEMRAWRAKNALYEQSLIKAVETTILKMGQAVTDERLQEDYRLACFELMMKCLEDIEDTKFAGKVTPSVLTFAKSVRALTLEK